MDLKIIYEDNNLLVVDKPAGVPVFKEGNVSGKVPGGEPCRTMADYLVEKYPELKKNGPPRYGIIHRLDKNTSGILLIAKNYESLIFFQKQFSAAVPPVGGTSAFNKSSADRLADRKNRNLEKKVEKRYIALVVGNVKKDSGIIETLIGRSPKNGKKQKVFLAGEPGTQNKRQAITEYNVLEKFTQSNNSAKGGIAAKRHLTRVNNYTLLEVIPKTGRKHQIRCHLAFINHPIAGDKVYGFKNQPTPAGLTRHFLHASYLRVELPNKETKEFESGLPEDLTKVLEKLK